MKFLTLLSCVFVLPVMVRAQSEDSWDSLKVLLVGQKIQVVDQQLKSQDGVFLSVTDAAIIYRVGQQESTVERANVLRVSSREHMGRGTKALIGMGIGAAAGALTLGNTRPGIVGALSKEEAAGAGAVLGTLIGAGVGAVLRSGHPIIYRAERRQDQTQP